MKKLILHPTDISQWYALVCDAETATQLVLSENTESYLVFLLQRFSQNPELAESTIAIDFLESMSKVGKQQIDKLIMVGDKSLLLSGLFPGIVDKRNVSLSYYLNVGKAAYLTASELQHKPKSDLFFDLSKRFLDLQIILQAIRGNFQQFSISEQSSFKINFSLKQH